MVRVLVLIALAAAAGHKGKRDGGAAPSTGSGRMDGGVRRDGGFDPMQPATWKLSARLGKDSEARKELVAAFTAPDGGIGEAPLTEAEANALLDDPRAELIYGEKTVSITAPSMLKRQRADHLDLIRIFVQPERIAAGAKFIQENQAVYDAVQAKTKVDRGVITGILMWESKLGTITGEYKAFNAFMSQLFFVDDAAKVALARPEEKGLIDDAAQQRRVETIRARARKNLVALVRQCKAKGMDALEVKGSWAGALGFPQFMPTSLRWAEDGDGDGKIDLFTIPDAVASVGKYLAANGFARDRKKAVWEYNHEAAYVDGVLLYGKALEAWLAGTWDGGVPFPVDGGFPLAVDGGT
jgi:membrane-bound lytic murein transglycosylase B